MSVVIDKSTFWRRLRNSSAWTKGRTAEPQQLQWADMDAIAVIASGRRWCVDGTYLLMISARLRIVRADGADKERSSSS